MSVSPRPLNIPDLVLEPLNETALIEAIEKVANTRQKSLLVVDLKKSLASIRHKLSIVMYQAALICQTNASDLRDFEAFMRQGKSPPNPSRVHYKGCTYEMKDIYHYRLLAGFFIESFAAANWSLLDVVGFLLRDLYGLNLDSKDVSFKKTVETLKTQKGKDQTPDAVYSLVLTYRTYRDSSKNHDNLPSWFPLLTEIRHQTTHRPITDICEVRTKSSFYPDIDETQGAFYLNQNLLSGHKDKPLCEFAKEVFEGIQHFIEKLYEFLRQAIEAQGSLPLS